MPAIKRQQPPYLQVAQQLRERITSGQLAPGDLLPSVRQLAADWGISTATASRALATLQTERLAEAKAGIGTVVAPASIHRHPGTRYHLLKRTGAFYTDREFAHIVSATVVDAPEDVAMALGIEVGAKVIRRDRVTYESPTDRAKDDHSPPTDVDIPQVMSTTWIDAAVSEQAPKLLERSRVPNGTTDYLCSATGRIRNGARDDIYARAGTPDEISALRLSEPHIVLVLLHTVFDQDGTALAYEVNASPGSRRTSYEYASGAVS